MSEGRGALDLSGNAPVDSYIGEIDARRDESVLQ